MSAMLGLGVRVRVRVRVSNRDHYYNEPLV